MNRRERVERLTEQALRDGQPHKYIQGRFLLHELDNRAQKTSDIRKEFIKKLRAL